jgi:hypothetical protein
MKSINSLSLVKTIIDEIMRMRVPRRPIVLIRVRFNTFVRCKILILLKKLFVVEFVYCSRTQSVCVCVGRVYIHIYIVTGDRVGVFVRQS